MEEVSAGSSLIGWDTTLISFGRRLGDDLGAQLPRGTRSHLLCCTGPVCEAVPWASECLGFKHAQGCYGHTPSDDSHDPHLKAEGELIVLGGWEISHSSGGTRCSRWYSMSYQDQRYPGLLASLLCILAFQPKNATTTGARILSYGQRTQSINWLHPGQAFFYQVPHVLGPNGVKRADEAQEHDFLHCMAPS